MSLASFWDQFGMILGSCWVVFLDLFGMNKICLEDPFAVLFHPWRWAGEAYGISFWKTCWSKKYWFFGNIIADSLFGLIKQNFSVSFHYVEVLQCLAYNVLSSSFAFSRVFSSLGVELLIFTDISNDFNMLLQRVCS